MQRERDARINAQGSTRRARPLLAAVAALARVAAAGAAAHVDVLTLKEQHASRRGLPSAR